MRKLWVSLGVALGLLVLFGRPVLADHSSTTELTVQFYQGPKTSRQVETAKINALIPDGQTVYHQVTKTPVTKKAQSTETDASMGAAIAAIRHGRLPQTSERQWQLYRLVGGLLLLMLILSGVLWYQLKRSDDGSVKHE
ncbi:hypothetical protein [Lactiplantibacillus daowaiensis]|uniref:Cell surface protein n=1 Tax=Lactiplantibacillus daowaiensis TaxID=2559918 RepID=A0ABW1S3F3_9LACO|nr:hypothetical protein [Lactiplantibacillus daowaiensis]